MKFTFAILASLVALTSASTIAATAESTMQNVLNNLSAIGKQFKSVDDLVKGFPQNGIEGATEIHDHQTQIINQFNDMFSSLDTLSKPVPGAFVQKILDAYTKFAPSAVSANNAVASKAAYFETLSPTAANNIKNDISILSGGCALAKAGLIAISPPSLAQPLNDVIGSIDTALGNGVAAFT